MKYELDKRPVYPDSFSEYGAVPAGDERTALLVTHIVKDIEAEEFNCNYVTTGDTMVVGDLEGNIYVCKVIRSYEHMVTQVEEESE